MKKINKVVISLGLLLALFVAGGVSLTAADNCCSQMQCCKGECHCACCQK